MVREAGAAKAEEAEAILPATAAAEATATAVRDAAFKDRPLEPQVMEKVTVECFGEEYPEPEKK